MSDFQQFLGLLLCYIALLILIGFYFKRKQQSQADFWLAGKSVGPVSIGISAAASWLTAGAMLSVTGFTIQAGFVLLDMSNAEPGAPVYLESIHPVLMGHGIILAMLTSGVVFVGVSLAGNPSPHARLDIFFKQNTLPRAFNGVSMGVAEGK